MSGIRSILRQFSAQLFFRLIQVVSLTVGFTVFIILLSLAMQDLGYDKFWNTSDRLYRVCMQQFQEEQLNFRSARSYRGLPVMMEEKLPEVTGMTRLMPDVITVFVGEQQIQDVRMFYADTNLFKVLPRKILNSESKDLFPGIHSMAISESLARKLYGSIDCLGKELRLNEGWIFYISTVFEDIPEKSHLHFDVLMSRASLVYYIRNFDNLSGRLVDNDEFEYVDPGPYHRSSWSNFRSYNYILLREGTDMDQLQDKTLELLGNFELPDRLQNASIVPEFQPVEKIHLHSDYPDEIKENSSLNQIYMLLLIGLVVLIISWINFVNLHAVVFIKGIRALGVRMILGAGQGRITREIFTEAFALSLMAALLSVVAIKITANLSSEFALDPKLLILLPLLGVMTALLAISVSLGRYRSARVMDHLKGEVYGKRKRTDYRRIMVLLQFTSGVVMIACTLVIFLQMRFTRNKELGFNDQNVIYSFSPMTMNQRPDIPLKLEMFRNQMSAIPGVTSFCVSSSVPGNSIRFPGFMVNRVIEGINAGVYLEPVNVDAYYFDLYEIELITGEGFRMDENYNVDEVILNHRAAVELGFSDPLEAVGEILRAGDNGWQIIGVVENYHHYSLKEKLLPLAFFKSLRWQASVGYYSFRLGTVSQQTIADIGKVWTRIYPGENFLYKFMEDSYSEQYASDRSMGRSFFIAAIIALLTSCLGLLGLTRFNILKRTKEIGIRKTFGSSSALILKRLQAETLFMVLVASVIGVPVSWWISRRWLENFSFRIELDWWTFLAATLLLLVVAVLTTLVQTWRASRANPVETLKYE